MAGRTWTKMVKMMITIWTSRDSILRFEGGRVETREDNDMFLGPDVAAVIS